MRLVCAGAVLVSALCACEGSTGSGGLSIPAPQYNNPAGPGTTASVSRQQTLEGAVSPGAGLTEIPLPNVSGFSVALALGTPPPQTAASPVASATAASSASGATVSPAALGSPSPSPSIAVLSSASPSAAAHVGASPAAAAKIATKTTIYPDDAPAAPSPKPTGDVQTFAKRTAIVRGFIEPVSDVSLYGLGAVRFTIPTSEQTSGRGFTVAVFAAGKKHHEQLIAFDASPVLQDNVVASALTSDPLVLKKSTGYLVMLYGDELAPTQPPAGSYPTPGTNPFPTQTPGQAGYPQRGYGQPGQQAGYPQQPGYPQPGATATPNP